MAIIADTHLPRGGRRLPAACLERLRAADLILHAGDFVAVHIFDELEALGPPVAAVQGNLDDARLVQHLPVERVVDADQVRIGMVHDAGARHARLRRLRRWFPDAHAVVFGHSHIPYHEEHGGFQIFNPGSPTDRRRQPRHTMGMARVDGDTVAFEHVALD